MRRGALLTAAVFLIISHTADACSVCFFGDPTEQANVALQKSILTLLGVLVVVLGAFVKFFLSVARRSKLADNGS